MEFSSPRRLFVFAVRILQINTWWGEANILMFHPLSVLSLSQHKLLLLIKQADNDGLEFVAFVFVTSSATSACGWCFSPHFRLPFLPFCVSPSPLSSVSLFFSSLFFLNQILKRWQIGSLLRQSDKPSMPFFHRQLISISGARSPH